MDNDDNGGNKGEDFDQFAVEEERVKPIDFGSASAHSPASQESSAPSAAASPEQGGNLPPEPEPEPFLKDEVFADEGAKKEMPPETPAKPVKGFAIGGGEPNYIHKGEYIDLTEAVPTLKRILIGAGWDQKSMEETVDVDLSLFMCNKHDETRIDEDFIFYNNERACDGAVQHLGDSRSGAGAGDDETIFIDLNGVPFDILKIVCVLSIYDPDFDGHHFGMVDNVYIRFVNKDDNEELFRYALDNKDREGGNAIILGTLIREGPKWIYEAAAHGFNGGLAKVATDYGIIIKELQSTLDVDDSIDKGDPEDLPPEG